MKTRNTFTKLLALIIALSMVMSVASVAFAERTKSSTDVEFYNNDYSYNPYHTDEIAVPNSGKTQNVTITMTAAPTREGYTFTGFNVYCNDKLLASNVQAGESISVEVTRSSTSSNWRPIDVEGQWLQSYVGLPMTHVDVEVDANITVVTKLDGTVTFSHTYDAIVTAVSGTITTDTLNNSALSFYRLSNEEYRANVNFTHYSTNVVNLTITLSVDMEDGTYRTMTVNKSFTGSALDAALALCPGSVRQDIFGNYHSSKGYDIYISDEEISEDFTHTVTFNTQAGGSLSGTTEFSGILNGTAWDTAVTVPGYTADNGYTFDGWYDAGGNKVTSFPATVDEDLTYTAHWKALSPETYNYYTVSYVLDGTTQTYPGYSVTDAGTMPTAVAPDASQQGYTFAGWYKQGTATELSALSQADFTLDTTRSHTDPAGPGTAQKTYNYYTLTLVGTLTKKTATVTYYSVTYTGNEDNSAATWPQNVSGVTTAPTLAAAATKNGYDFNGWTISGNSVTAINWNASYVVVTSGPEVYDQASDTYITNCYRSVMVNGTFTEVEGTVNKYYTVIYKADINHDGTAEEVTMSGFSCNDVLWAGVNTSVAGAPAVEDGYTFAGWDQTTAITQAAFGAPTSSLTIPSTQPGVGSVTNEHYTLVITGTVTRNEASKNVYEINYSVTGRTDKVTGSYEAYQSGSSAFNAQALPTVAAGYSITGWNIGGTNYTSTLPWPSTPTSHVERLEQCDGEYVFVTYYYYTLNASANVAENEHETVNIYYLSYQISGTYTDLQGNTLSAGNMPNNQSGVLYTAPTPSTQVPTMTGHSFVGWSTLDWGTPVHTSYINPQTNATVDVYTYTATITGTFVRNTVVENDYYSLSYSISGTYTHPDGTALTPTAPDNVPNQLNSKPALVAGNALDGHTFDGWKQDGTALSVGSTPAYTQAGSTVYSVNGNNCFVKTKYFAAAVVGTYTYSGTTEVNLWNLTYTGDSALADAGTWPANLSGETSEPSITTLVPAKLGYTFDGWTQNGSVVSSITWTSNVQYTLGTDNVYVKTTTKSATLNGTLTKKGSKTNEIYVVDYTVTGGSVDYNYLDVNETNPGTLPVIADNLHETGKVFSGWNPASLDWDSVTPVTTDYVYDDTVGLWVNTSTKTIDVSGSFGTVTHVYVYELTFTGPEGATLPAKLVSTGSAPSYSDKTASLANNRFDGWNPASLSEGGYVENTDRQDTSEDRLTVTHYMEASVEAQFVPVADAESYTLHYELTGSVDGQPANPADDGPSSAAIMPNNGNVPATVGNYYFTGWSAPSYAQVGEPVMETVDGVEVTTTYYEATVTGFYTDMHIVDNEISLYSLIYQGYVDGVVFWPGNVIGSETQPTLAGDPILNGYTFTGWTPAALDWGTATVSTSMQVVTPAEGEQNEPYLLRTTTYTITVTANFEATEIPTGTPEEIPLGTPGTGGAELIGFASVLAIIGMAILTTTIVRRRRNDSKDGE